MRPSVAEFAELQRLLQMYRKRPFDVVTVSINTPDEKDLVLNFLREQHAITRNLLFNFNDPADGVAAFGADWSGGVPFTALLSPEGKVLYRTQGDQPVGVAPHYSQIPSRPLHRDARLLEQHVLMRFAQYGDRRNCPKAPILRRADSSVCHRIVRASISGGLTTSQ